jgi:peptidoglycan/xylan/chitin deacetylase (PgdA/CDA1 family)
MRCAAILTYHPIHITENTYAGNDILALDSDLAAIERFGIPIRSLDQIFTCPGSESLLNEQLTGPVVSITFDDGSIFDFIDHAHPTCGPQVSAASVLRKNATRYRTLAATRPLASTFVIASPNARNELDKVDYFGGGYWPDYWWQEAGQDGILGVESHSWDHNHPSLSCSQQRDNVRGTFKNIETVEEAEAEIAQSIEYISDRAMARPKFFAYPWGEANDFLVNEYLPHRGVELGLRAALSGAPTASGYVTDHSNRWLIPRFICGDDWKSEGDLERLLIGLTETAGRDIGLKGADR